MKRSINTKNISPKLESSNRQLIFYKTLLVFLPLFVLLISGPVFVIYLQEKHEHQMIQSLEYHIVDVRQESIQSHLSHITSDLLLLSQNNLVAQLLNDLTSTESLDDVTGAFMRVSLQKCVYDQVRLIDEKGMEIIRVNFNQGHPKTVLKEKLQNKKDRYYFVNALKLSENEIYISPLDLNVENGSIEYPNKPIIRIATPVFDQQGNKRGIIVLNYFGQMIIDHFNDLKNPLIKSQVMLLNAESYWLKGPSPECEWGFMYQDKQDITFSNEYPASWEIIKSAESKQFETEKGMFTFKTIHPIQRISMSDSSGSNTILSSKKGIMANDYYWKVLSHIPAEILYDKGYERRKIFAFLLIFSSLGLWMISRRLAIANYSKRKAKFELKESERKLKESNQAKDKFFSIISHDLRSPFHTLLGLSNQLLENHKNYDEAMRERLIRYINESSKKTFNLLEDLLTWSRSQTGKIEFAPLEVNIKKLISEIVLASKLIAKTKNISLSDRIEIDPTVIADKDMLKTVLRNLISNAIKFTKENGAVIVSVNNTIKQDFIEVSVADTGIGIPEDIIDDLFLIDKITSSPGTEKETGTGLGLILCKEFVEKQGGKIWVKSEVGKGSEFIFTLPVVQS